MKSIHYAIASIVASHTGFGLHRDSDAASYTAAESVGRRIRAKSVIALLGLIGHQFGKAVALLREHGQRRQKIREIVSLSDRQLDDIGLNPGDVIALQQGVIDLEQLEARRIENLGNKRIRLSRGAGRNRRVARHAVNEAIFARAKCA